MQTFECPKCGAPVNYEPSLARTTRCDYCHSQLAVPDEMRGIPAHIISQIDINVGPEVAAGAKKVAKIFIVIPILIMVMLMVVMFAVFGMMNSVIKSVTAPFKGPLTSRGRAGDPANSFANEVLKFGNEGIGPGMMTDARSIAVDGTGRIYVGEYSGGRIQVFDQAGNFITQWTGDTKMPLRGMGADRKGNVYLAQHGIITIYEGATGKSIGQIAYKEQGFDDGIQR
jgi:hypothetical protein